MTHTNTFIASNGQEESLSRPLGPNEISFLNNRQLGTPRHPLAINGKEVVSLEDFALSRHSPKCPV